MNYFIHEMKEQKFLLWSNNTRKFVPSNSREKFYSFHSFSCISTNKIKFISNISILKLFAGKTDSKKF